MIAIKDGPHHTDGEGDDRFYERVERRRRSSLSSLARACAVHGNAPSPAATADFHLKPRISCFWNTRRKYSQNTCVGTVAEADPLGVDRLAQLLDESVQKPYVSLVGAQLRIESARHVDTGQVDDRHGLGGDELADGEELAGIGMADLGKRGLDVVGAIEEGMPAGLIRVELVALADRLVPNRAAAITTASHSGAVTFLRSGGFVATTAVFTGRRGDPDVQVTRFNPDGSIASTGTGIDYAGQNGALVVSDVPAAVAIQAYGQAVIGGTTQSPVSSAARRCSGRPGSTRTARRTRRSAPVAC